MAAENQNLPASIKYKKIVEKTQVINNLEVKKKLYNQPVTKLPNNLNKKPASIVFSGVKDYSNFNHQQADLNNKKPNNKNLIIKNKLFIPEPKFDNQKLIYKRKPVIVIDAGHGGKDPGATGKLGTQEKNITLSYAIALKKELEKSGRYKVQLTRDEDKFVFLSERVKIARKAGADVLISLHADSMMNSNIRGFSVYTLSGKRAEEEAEKLLKKSDKEEVIKGANLKGQPKLVKEALIGFAQDSTKYASDDFAKLVAKNLGKKIQPLKRQNREASLAVLTGADIPSVLIELGYLSNIQEERLLKQPEHKKKIVTSIANAVNEYFRKYNF
jgi:N-acetylmuramoyl-L-alanine amidase